MKMKSCFECDGTGEMCNVCCESAAACTCNGDFTAFTACTSCDGTGEVDVDRTDDD